jgi:DNA-binding NarL/FixJ family response regulator
VAAASREQVEQAGLLLGAVDALRDTLVGSPSASQRQKCDRVTAILQAKMKPMALAAMRERGRSLSLDQAIALALQELRQAAGSATKAALPVFAAPPTELPSGPDELTPREAEVLRLVATGLSNKDVAARLTLSLGTVQNYLHNIYEKLGVTSRSAATRYAWEHHLLTRDSHVVAQAGRRSA